MPSDVRSGFALRQVLADTQRIVVRPPTTMTANPHAQKGDRDAARRVPADDRHMARDACTFALHLSARCQIPK
jgi:hypothetical protein